MSNRSRAPAVEVDMPTATASGGGAAAAAAGFAGLLITGLALLLLPPLLGELRTLLVRLP